MLLGWLWAAYGLAVSYRSAIYSSVYRLAMGQQWAGYRLAIGWLCLKINPLQDIVIYYTNYVPKWYKVAINTLDCSVFIRFFSLSAGYRLAFGWLCPTIRKLQDIVIYYNVLNLESGTWLLSILGSVVCSQDFLANGWLSASYWLAIFQHQYNSRHSIYHYVPKWHMAVLNTLDSSVFKRFFGYRLAISWLSAGLWLGFGWLLVGYVPTSIYFKTGSYYYVPRVHMAAINTLGCSVFTRLFGYQLAIWLAISPNQYTSRHSHILLCTKVAHNCNQYFRL